MKTAQDPRASVSRFARVVLLALLVQPGLVSAILAADDPVAAKGKERLELGFRALDTNRDGRLDRKEFSRIVQFSPRLRDNPENVDYLFNRLDKNQDDFLTLEEYRGIALISALARQNRSDDDDIKSKPADKSVVFSAQPPTAEQLDFFERKIRPLLAEKCYKCHSANSEKVKGGLLLDSRAGVRAGGDSGPVVMPGNPAQSLLIKAVRGEDPDLQMPPKEKLSADAVANLERWVKMGVPDPREGRAVAGRKSIDIEKGREHWAFQPPQKSAPPPVKNAGWPRSEIDRFVLAGLEAQGLRPAEDADRRTLARRVYFDLIGLPPAPEEIESFANDKSPQALEQLVDKLLASPQFGEKWGRHWLDVARYAESSGKENNIVYPHAWRYRDYVIAAFNADKPYDRFLKEQIAGDLLPIGNDNEWATNLVATGFLAIGPKSHNTRDPRQFAMDLADEQIDAMSQGMLGLTVACARCHDHKFDPIPQKDYYALAGIFVSTETRYGTPEFIQNNQATPLIALPPNVTLPDAEPLTSSQLAALRRQLEQAKKERDEILAEAREKKDRSVLMANPRLIRTGAQVAIIEKQLARHDENGWPKKFAMGVQERTTPRDVRLLQRGELDKAGDSVPRGFLQVLNAKQPPAIKEGSGRMELAEWIASSDNPLTARVMANRVWQHLFGRGLVATPDNFGTTGQKPSHPQLLDQLAVSLVKHGWSVKQLIREIVLSRAYQLGSGYDAQNYALDPDNIYLWRMTPRRLDAEAIRDAMLAVSGTLNLAPPRGSPVANSEGPVQVLLRFGALQSDRNCRSVYLPIVRDQVPESLAVFDFAEPSLVTGDREDTTVPSQALYLMNNATVQRLAEAFSDRLMAAQMSGAGRVRLAYQLAFGRLPTESELKATTEFFRRFYEAEAKSGQNRPQTDRASTVAFCQALFASAEFRILN